MTRFIGQPHDFDFLIGRWHVHNRRLAERHVGSTAWRAFDATTGAQALLGGIVSVDETEFVTEGFSGVTFRTLDLAKSQWSIYWINSRSGEMGSPMRGGFDGDRGEFFGNDIDDGQDVSVRFIWQRLGPDVAHWEQAFSLDAGATWETNWTMDLARLEGSTA